MAKFRVLTDLLFWTITRILKPFKAKKKCILIIRPDAIGDFILWLPYASSLRERFPRSDFEITLVANKLWADWSRELLDFDEILEIDRKKLKGSLSYRYHFASKLLRSFEQVLYPCYSKEWDGVFISMIPFSSQKKAWKGDAANISPALEKLTNYFFDKLLDGIGPTTQELSKNNLFHDLISQPNYCLPTKKYRIIDSKYVVFGPGAGSEGRRWPIERFLALAEYIHHQFKLEIILCGGPNESELAKAFEGLSFIHNYIGRTNLSELAGIIEQSELVVTNETSLAHLANLVERPSLCFLGGGHFGRFMPLASPHKQICIFEKMSCYNCDWKCIQSHIEGEAYPCIANLSLEQAKLGCRELLKA